MTQPAVVSGAASDEELDLVENQDPDADVDPDEQDEDEPDLSDFTPEDYRKLMAKLAKTRREAKNLRVQNRKLREGDDSEDDEVTAERKRAQELSRWQQRAVRSGARAALTEKGADPELIDLLVGKIKFEEIDFDDEDEPILDDWLDEMEEKYPKLFTPAQPKRRVPSVNQGAGSEPKKKRELSYGEQVIAAGKQQYGRRPGSPRGRR